MASLPNLLDRIRALIAAPSVSSVNSDWDQGNNNVIELLAGWLDDLGYRIEVQPIAGQSGKSNLIATLGQGPDGLVLAGHTDTVPYDADRWSQDPFTLTEANQRLYGLGTSDMKAFLAIAMEAALQFSAKDLCNPLILLATADEESSMAGAKTLVDSHKPQARHAVIGEPTNLRPVHMHKGIMMECIRLTGHSGHSSDPALGNNALEGMHRVIRDLLEWRQQLQAKYHNALFAVPVPTLNLGHIHGGDNPNRICADCELHIDLRPLPGMDLEALRGELKRRVNAVLADSGLEADVHPLIDGTPAMETASDSQIVTAAAALTGYSPEAVAFGTEGPYLNSLGMNTVILGPGDIAQAHQPDEYLALERIEPTVLLLRKLIQQFCCNQ